MFVNRKARWRRERGPRERRKATPWTSPLRAEGSLTSPVTPGGQDGGEADPAAVRGRVQGASGPAAARGRQGAVRGRDRAGAEPRPAELVAQRAPGRRLGRGVGPTQGGAGRSAAAQARGQAARGGGRDPQEGGGLAALARTGGARRQVRPRGIA